MMSRSRNGIYKLDNLPFSSRDFHKKFTFISGPLSLFDEEDDPEEGNENPDVERTLTPVEDSIKGPIASFSSFAKLIRPRLTPKEGIPGLSVSDQQELIGVIMSEINNVWGDMKSLPPDPFLTYQENMELQRRLAIEIVTLAQGLFLKFLNKAQNLHERGVFSGTANMSRLKTQLAIDANKSFNVLSIRRNLAIDMKHPCDTSTISSTKLAYLGGKKTYKPLVVRQEEAKIRLTKEEMLQQRIKSELSDLKKQMPKLKADFFVGMFPEEVLDRSRRPTPSGPESIDTDSQPELMDVFIEETALREKCVSEPYLPTGESLLEELGLTEDDINVGMKGLPRSTSVNKVEEQILVKEIDGRISSKDIKLGTPEYASNDLRKLIASRGGKTQNENSQDDNSDDLPPLLQALTHYNTKRRDKIQEELDYDELLGDRGSVIGSSKASSVALDPTIIDENITEFTGEDHPQPAVVSLRLPDKSVVRTSDVRVSNRVNKSSLVLQKYPTIYNDLTGEDYTFLNTAIQTLHSIVSINPTTVKWLDRNLFIGDEIKEVYQEVIRTMNADFLLFDKDPYVERCATDIDVSLCNASTSLTKSKKDRIINQKLHKGIPPPWERDTADNWRNNPKFGGLGREDIIQSKIGKESSQEGKSYNSWLAWWRSTINFDDYLKYMSTQDNDFLSMIYHLYDSENDSDDEGSLNESRPTTVQLALGRERERMLAELKAKKTEYNTGFWNANSVLIGGLGQDPVVNEADLLSMMEGLGVVKDAGTVSQVSFSSDRKSYTSSMSNRESLGNKTANSMQAKSDVSSKDRTLSHQERLERLWTILCMPKAKRLDMAIKYSGESHKNRLGDALDAWEAAATAIIEREALLTKLENFERDASNPNRFFEKGEAGTSLSRIRESKVRDSFDKKMSDMDREVKRTATLVKKQFGDEVIFQGRPCLDKLRHDRTEMLYWLQQERRKQFLNKEMMKEVSLTLLELPPLSANSML